MYYLYDSPLMMLLLAGVVDCYANGEHFEEDPSLADKVCPVDRRVYEQQGLSLISCVYAASRKADCLAVGYNKEQNMCYGCDTATGEFQTLEGTVFYSRPKAYPDGFEDISGYRLMVVNNTIDQRLSYDQAHNACAAHSASLVRIDSPEKQSAIRNYLDTWRLTNVAYYIQCRRDTSDGVWKFDDGTPVSITNDYWDTGYPVNNTGYDCGRMHSDFSYHWRNHGCGLLFGYICEIK